MCLLTPANSTQPTEGPEFIVTVFQLFACLSRSVSNESLTAKKQILVPSGSLGPRAGLVVSWPADKYWPPKDVVHLLKSKGFKLDLSMFSILAADSPEKGGMEKKEEKKEEKRKEEEKETRLASQLRPRPQAGTQRSKTHLEMSQICTTYLHRSVVPSRGTWPQNGPGTCYRFGQ
ncbi:hypothetical protein LX36DRAFT_676377 [Colletotrichum falcatum]|nr:hypothetical protein LX36DRAFT_676377 [Colletotrichum falcatum]